MIWIHLGSSLANQSDAYPLTPEGVVRKFCQLDAEGYRLGSDTWTKVSPLVTWTEEAGDMIFVIGGFKVSKATILDSTAEVIVEYEVLGSTNFIEFSEAPKQKSKVTFKIVKQIGRWKIQEPITAPHVDWKTAIAHLKDLQRTPERKEQLELIIQKIMKAREKIKKNKKVGE